MAQQKSQHCMVCGQQLQYRERGMEVTCNRCNKIETSAIICPNSHYICNHCHSADTVAKLPRVTHDTRGQAPEDILEEILECEGLPMHGPEHHAIVALAMLQASVRAKIKLPENYIEEAIRRSLQVPGGACGYLGACGGAISLGIAVSLVTDATPLTGLARGMANRATAKALLRCGDDDARCCKRALRSSVAAGREFFEEELGIVFPKPLSNQQCHEMSRNVECSGEHCAYFRRARSNAQNA